jgi:hypothetical protein
MPTTLCLPLLATTFSTSSMNVQFWIASEHGEVVVETFYGLADLKEKHVSRS